MTNTKAPAAEVPERLRCSPNSGGGGEPLGTPSTATSMGLRPLASRAVTDAPAAASASTTAVCPCMGRAVWSLHSATLCTQL